MYLSVEKTKIMLHLSRRGNSTYDITGDIETMDYKLENGEEVLIRETYRISVEGDIEYDCIHIMLTTKYLVFLDFSYLLGGEQEERFLDRLPISSIKRQNNNPEVFIAPYLGSILSLVILFENIKIRLLFHDCISQDKELARWKDTIMTVSKFNESTVNDQTDDIDTRDWICTQCGNQLTEGDVFCASCGSQVIDSPTNNNQKQEEIY